MHINKKGRYHIYMNHPVLHHRCVRHGSFQPWERGNGVVHHDDYHQLSSNKSNNCTGFQKINIHPWLILLSNCKEATYFPYQTEPDIFSGKCDRTWNWRTGLMEKNEYPKWHNKYSTTHGQNIRLKYETCLVNVWIILKWKINEMKLDTALRNSMLNMK